MKLLNIAIISIFFNFLFKNITPQPIPDDSVRMNEIFTKPTMDHMQASQYLEYNGPYVK